MRCEFFELSQRGGLCGLSTSSRRSLPRWLGLCVLAVVCALPFGLAFAFESNVAPYLALVAFVPAMYVIRRLVSPGEIVAFAVVASLFANAMVTYWLPPTVADMLSLRSVGATLLSVVLWLCWCGSNSLFLLIYRYCHAKCLVGVSCLGVVLFNYWPSVFGVNPFFALMHADGLSGSTFFLGTAVVELLAVLCNACLVSALVAVSLGPLYRALLIILALAALDGISAWYLSSMTTRDLHVALVQAGNVYSQKLSSADEIEALAQQIVEEPQLKPDLVVFPENVFSFNFADDPASANAAAEALKRFSDKHGVAFLLSTVQASVDGDLEGKKHSKDTRISSLLINHGQLEGYADKAKTIPFAEYTPLWAVATFRRFGMAVESRVPSSRYQLGTVNGVRIIPLSCFESIHQNVVEARLDGRPGLLVDQSNMDSFGQPGASNYRAAIWGHMAQELRWVNQWQVPIVRAVKSGGSTVIDAGGHLNKVLLEQSWGQEWVSAKVSVPEFTPLNGAMALVRKCLGWLINVLAIAGLVQYLALYVRNKHLRMRRR